MTQLLLIEDDTNLGSSLLSFLENEGFQVLWKKSLSEARNASLTKIDICVLDWMLPDGQGIDFLKDIRSSKKMLPVIMLTARNELIDKVVGLESGANDYITKPFEPRELVARIRVQLRDHHHSSSMTAEQTLIVRKDLSIDVENRIVRYLDQEVVLTKMEYELLLLLAEKPGRPYSREEILNKVWGFENYPTTRTVDTHILQLRQKFHDNMFETVRGVGYRFSKEFAQQ